MSATTTMHDVIIVGGSYAGLSASLQLARARRKILVIDAGSRRNRFASSSHGFLGQDGRDPAAIVADARAQLMKYPTVTWLDGSATAARARGDGFTVGVASGEQLATRRVILAAGVTDELPAIPGVQERWGQHVFHCPYCHGYELGGGRIGVLATSPLSVHQGMLLPDWGPTTYFTRGLFEPSADELATLAKRDVTIEHTPVRGVTGAAEVELDDGRVLAFAGLFTAPTTRITTSLPAQLGCELEAGPLGSFLKTDLMKETTVRGVFACGDIAVATGAVASAVGEGARAGYAAHQSLFAR